MKRQNQNGKKHAGVFIALLCAASFALGIVFPKGIHYFNQKNSQGVDKIETVYSMLKNNWYYSDQVKDIDQLLSEQALTGMTSLEIDPHTNYFDLENAKAFQNSLSGSSVGVGFNFYVREDGNFVIRHVYIHSAADLAGLQAGDIITVVGNKICSETSSEEIIKYIQEHEGKEITLHILRDGKVKHMSVVPGYFDSTVICEMTDTYGEIILSSFSEHSGEDFADAVERIKEADISNLLIDLRGNTGGYLSAVVDIASTLIPEGSIVFKEDLKGGKVEENKTNNEFEYVPFDQIVILQDGNSASASEVLIGALRDNLKDTVTTVGTKSYGKGTEQVTIPFKDGTSIKYTIAEWKTPKGTSINLKGFEPDIQVKLPDVHYAQYREMEEDEIIEADSVHINARAIQLFLQYLGYDVDRTDTYLSVQSGKAIHQFQEDHGLQPTSDVDMKTWELLQKLALLKMNENEALEDEQRNRAIQLF